MLLAQKQFVEILFPVLFFLFSRQPLHAANELSDEDIVNAAYNISFIFLRLIDAETCEGVDTLPGRNLSHCRWGRCS